MKKKDPNKPKKPVYKRVWFWILMFFVVCGIIGTVSDPPASQTNKTEESTNQQQQEEQSEESAKDSVDVAEEKDTRIYGLMKSAEARFNGVSKNMESGNLLDIYDDCKNASSMLSQVYGQIGDFKTEANKEYVQYAQFYAATLSSACDNIVKYVDKQEMKYLSKAKEDIQDANSFLQQAMLQRQAYLLDSGLTTEDIEAQDAQFE